MTEPAWKRNGRTGPLDWWLGCRDHGYNYQRGCMSCSMAEDHNIEFQQKLDRERNAGVARLDAEGYCHQTPMPCKDDQG